MQKRKRARQAPRPSTTPAARPAASTTTTAAPRWIAPSPEERERRRQALREEMERHDATCEGCCGRCIRPSAVTAAPGDDVHDVRAWTKRLGGLPSLAEIAEVERAIEALLKPKTSGGPSEVERARIAAEVEILGSAYEEIGEEPEEPDEARRFAHDLYALPRAFERSARLRSKHREKERAEDARRLADELAGMPSSIAVQRVGADDLVLERVERTGVDVIPLAGGSMFIDDGCEDDKRRLIRRIPLDGGGVRIVMAQDADHAKLARRLAQRLDPAAIDRLDGVDGIAISTVEIRAPDPSEVTPVEVVRLVEQPSEVTLRAVRDWPAGHAPGRPGGLWWALRLDLPGVPKEREIDALKERAQDLRRDHDRFVDGVTAVGTYDARNECSALRLRCDALIATHEWLDARRRAQTGKGAEVAHRQAQLKILAEGLKVDALGGWTLTRIAELILASREDWTIPPCPVYVARWRKRQDSLRAMVKEISRDLGHCTKENRIDSVS